MDRLQRRRKRRKRFEELHISRRFYREARREGNEPMRAFMITTSRLMKRIYLPFVSARFDAVSSLSLHRLQRCFELPTGKSITKSL